MISTKGRYALRVMIDLAEQDREDYVPLNEIAARQGISQKYLEIVLKILVQEKLLKGHRGKGGGYKLTKPASQYNVGEILLLAEGTLAPVACLEAGADACPRKENCKTLPMWTQFNKMVNDYFKNITLEDLVEERLVRDPTNIV